MFVTALLARSEAIRLECARPAVCAITLVVRTVVGRTLCPCCCRSAAPSDEKQAHASPEAT